MRHLRQDQIERIMLDLSPASPEERQHLLRCADCARALQREAALELEFRSALDPAAEPFGQVSSPRGAGARTQRWWIAAAAAALLAVFAWRWQVDQVHRGQERESVVAAMPPESLITAPGFLVRPDSVPAAGDDPSSWVGHDVVVPIGDLTMIQ